jgi:hypothetical protein
MAPCLSTFLLILLSSLAAVQAQFYNNCFTGLKTGLHDHHYFVASCRRDDGKSDLTTEEDLDLCIANAGGQLVARAEYVFI